MLDFKFYVWENLIPLNKNSNKNLKGGKIPRIIASQLFAY